MADVKFSELSSLSAAASADVLAIVDSSESASKKLTIDNLFGTIPVNLAVTDTTQSTSNTTGSVTTTGGLGVSKDAYVGGVLNVFGNTVLNGANTNIAGTTLTVDANVVIQSTLTVNSTTALVGTSLPLHFRDTGLSLSSPTNGTLDLAADTILEITAPTTNVIATTAVTIHSPAISANGTVTIGASADGYDVTLHGASAGALMLWDESADALIVRGATADHATTSAGRIVLQTNQAAVADGDRIGQIDFQASNETGADALLVSASIWAEADDTFDATGNETELVFATGASETAAEQMRLTSSGQLGINIATPASLLDVRGTVQVGVDDTGYDVQIFGDTASSVLLWDTSDDQLEFGNATMTMSDARTSGTATITGLTIDMYNKLDTGSSNDRIGAAISTYGDTSTYEIRDSVGIRAMSRQSTSAEVARLNTPIHAILDLANTAVANNSGTTLSGAYGLVIDHDDTIATRTGQPTAFVSFGEMYVGGTEGIETAYLFDVFPNGKTGDATYGTAANVAFYVDGAQYSTTRDVMLLCSTDGAPGTDAFDKVLMEPDVNKDIILLDEVILSGGYIAFERGHLVLDEEEGLFIQTEDYTSEVEAGFLLNEENDSAIMLEESSSSNRSGSSNFIMFETGSQDADGVLKIKVNGEYKYLQLYNEPGTGVATEASGGY